MFINWIHHITCDISITIIQIQDNTTTILNIHVYWKWVTKERGKIITYNTGKGYKCQTL